MTRECMPGGPRTVRVRRAGTLSALLLVAGCSLAGLTGGAGDGGSERTEGSAAHDATGDAMHDAGHSVTHDAGRDVAREAGRVVDARTEASAGYCKSLVPAPTFCEDFDEGSLTQGWSQQFNYGGGALSLDTQVFVSPPASAHAVIPAEMGEDYGQAVVNVAFDQTFTTAHIDFDYICTEVDTTTVLVAAWGSYNLNLAFDSGDVEVAELLNASGSESNMWQFPQVAPGSPLHVSVTLSTVATGTGGEIDVFYNHSAAAAIEQPLNAPPVVGSVQFDFGAVYSQGAGWNANFDNIVVDLH